jgi:hypothetical protein
LRLDQLSLTQISNYHLFLPLAPQFMIGDGTEETLPDCREEEATSLNPPKPSPPRRLTTPTNVGDPIPSSISVSRSPSITGPWSPPSVVSFDRETEMLCGGHTNPSPHFNPDGSVHLAFQSGTCDSTIHGWALVGLAKAAEWNETYVLTSDSPVTPHDGIPGFHPACVAGVDEDPFFWVDARGFHLITHGMCPSGIRQAHYKYSDDEGLSWKTSPRQTYPYFQEFEDGKILPTVYARVERPQLAFNGGYDLKTGFAIGGASVLYNGVCGSNGNVGDMYECVFDGFTGKTLTIARPLKQD